MAAGTGASVSRASIRWMEGLWWTEVVVTLDRAVVVMYRVMVVIHWMVVVMMMNRVMMMID